MKGNFNGFLAEFSMAILAGIDEAGYGPLLGPLVVSATALRVPEDLLKADFWKVLETAVGSTKRGLGGRILVTDSKKAYTKSSGIGHLRRSVLTAAACSVAEGGFCGSAGEFLRAVCPDCWGRFDGYAWYKGLDDLDLGADKTDIEIAASVLRKAMDKNEVSICTLVSRCLDAGYYNRQVAAVRNKSNVLFTALCELVGEIFKEAGDNEEVHIIIDRQGGRVLYGGPLMRMFPEMELSVLLETERISSYDLSAGDKTIRLHFKVEADKYFLPVSLSSMVSKYVREVMMEAINNYFLGHCADIKPTAGYWKDGQRFVADIAAMVPELEYDREMFIRSR